MTAVLSYKSYMRPQDKGKGQQGRQCAEGSGLWRRRTSATSLDCLQTFPAVPSLRLQPLSSSRGFMLNDVLII
ncbi:unnamed protein product [Boreogadus saida]